MSKEKRNNVTDALNSMGIQYDTHEHKAVPTAEEAGKVWAGLNGTFCKNLFFRNHKGNRHYLVLLEFTKSLAIKDLEQRLKQGKLSLASDKRLSRYMGLEGGSVSVFGLINDIENHVYVFVDENLRHADRLGFHPNDNTATLLISREDFEKFLDSSGNSWEYVGLYD